MLTPVLSYSRITDIQRFELKDTLPEVFCKVGVLKNFAKFTKNTCAGVYFNKVAALSQQLNEKGDSSTVVFL